ncbi:MAG TPA: DUF4062 domain-containing protein [Candidatus Acidoferrales bacterium]|nr:DUF4062 domain-containing protein [Candidatus Acidoferrales bacterium]
MNFEIFMSKPRTFISSTCYDLQDARAALTQHLKSLGHELLVSDSSTFGVSFAKHSHHACLDQVDNCDYFILIIGGRHGGTFIGSEKSITNEEYRRALKGKKPIMTFVKKAVDNARQIYKRNPKADFKDVVNDVRVFDFIDLVTSQSEDNWIKTFETVEDIKEAITSQFAYVALQFSKDLITRRSPKTAVEEDQRSATPFPAQVTTLADSSNTAEAAADVKSFKALHKTLGKIINSAASGIDEKLKLLWVMGRYGTVSEGGSIYMNNDRFKQYAWSTSKGQRVFNQIKDFGIIGEYDEDGDGGLQIRLWFKNDDDGGIGHALARYVADLQKKYAEDGIDFFKRADMTLYA